MRSIRALGLVLIAPLLIAGCGGSEQEPAMTPALKPQTAAETAGTSTRQYVGGYYVETGADSVPAQVNRLYRAVFNRAADAAGLGFHVASIERSGLSLSDVVNEFMASPEFKANYGAASDSDFVTLLYANVLKRQPDASGFAFWTNALATGTTRAQVVLGFSESAENKLQTAADVAAGLKFLPYPSTRIYLADGSYIESNPDGTAGQVYRLYQSALDRAPDQGGLGFQIGSIERSGLSLVQVAQGFIASTEFSTKYGALDNTQFVTQLYANVLHRAPDAAGLAFHVGNLNAGVSRAQVLVDFSESPENKANTAAAISAGIRFTPWPQAPVEPAVDLSALKPRFLLDLQPTTVKSGAALSLAAQVEGYGVLTYQWSRGGIEIPGATAASYTLSPASYGEDGTSYTLKVTNVAGETTSASATITVSPPSSALTVSACRQITSPGAYKLSADLAPTGTAACIAIHDTSDVQLDCAGHTLSAYSTQSEGLDISSVRNLSVKNCNIVASWMKMQDTDNASLTHNTITKVAWSLFDVAVLNFDRNSRMTFDSNVMEPAVFQQSYGDRNTISRNRITSVATNNAGAGLIGSTYGSASRITGNTLDGKAESAGVGSFYGVVLQDETGAVAEDNVINRASGSGFELSGVIDSATIRRNVVADTPGLVGGSAWLSLFGSVFADNTALRTPVFMMVEHMFGLRPAGFDEAHRRPADTGIYFRDNIFTGNVITDAPTTSGGFYFSVFFPVSEKMEYNGTVGAMPGEQIALPSQIFISNNVFTGNDFGYVSQAPYFGQPLLNTGMVVDGGGNKCRQPDPASNPTNYPLTCN